MEGDGWSVILKLLHHSEVGNPRWLSSDEISDPMYWRREALAYDSGLLDSLAGGLRPARCLGCVERADGSVALWLEDVQGSPATEWPVERFGPAARHLGQAQGEFLAGRALPDEPWLSCGWLRAYLERRRDRLEEAPVSHPLVPDELLAESRRLWAERERILDLLDRLPRTLCHLDFWSRNLFAAPDGETVAIDWAFVGIGAAGEDPGNLVPDAMFDGFLDAVHAGELSELVFGEYVAGLRDAGWEGDERVVRLGYAASAALKYVWMAPHVVKYDDFREARIAVLELLFDLGREADQLASFA